MSTLAEESLQPSPRRASRSGGRPVPRQRPRGNLRFVVAGLVIVAAIGYMIYAAMQSGAESVSYTHLTLPTNREV